MVVCSKTCELRAILTQTPKVEAPQWRRSEISSLPEHDTSPSSQTTNGSGWTEELGSAVRWPALPFEIHHSHVLADGAPVWVHAASASCVCVICVFPPLWVCLMRACRPCHVSHTEPNAINVSAHGATLWGRGHGGPGGARPERSARRSAGQHQQHVSGPDEKWGGVFMCSYVFLLHRFKTRTSSGSCLEVDCGAGW